MYREGKRAKTSLSTFSKKQKSPHYPRNKHQKNTPEWLSGKAAGQPRAGYAARAAMPSGHLDFA
jgi:hypothetical protein